MRELRLKDVGRWLSGGTPPRADEASWDGDVPWLSAKDFSSAGLKPPTAFITGEAAQKHSTVVPEGALVMVTRGMALIKGIPVGITDKTAAFNQDLRAVVPRRDVDVRFLRFALIGRRAALARHIDRAAHGTAKLLPGAFAEQLLVPQRSEQERVVAALEVEEERLSVARARLTALADRALEPALARAEQAWVDQPLGKIGYRFEVQLGKKLYESRIEHATAKPYLRIANVYWDRFALDDVKVMNFEGHESSFYALRPGDLLVCEGRGLGRSAVWEGQIEPCYFQMSLNRVRSLGLDSTRWVMWCLRVLNRRGVFTGDAPGVPHVTAEQLRATRIPLPSPEVQHRVVAEIDADADRARRLSGLAGQLDERLKEYRDSLITAAVHGRLDLGRASEAELDERLHAATEDLVP